VKAVTIFIVWTEY